MLERLFYHNKNEISKPMDSPGIGIWSTRKKITQILKKKRKTLSAG